MDPPKGQRYKPGEHTQRRPPSDLRLAPAIRTPLASAGSQAAAVAAVQFGAVPHVGPARLAPPSGAVRVHAGSAAQQRRVARAAGTVCRTASGERPLASIFAAEVGRWSLDVGVLGVRGSRPGRDIHVARFCQTASQTAAAAARQRGRNDEVGQLRASVTLTPLPGSPREGAGIAPAIDMCSRGRWAAGFGFPGYCKLLLGV